MMNLYRLPTSLALSMLFALPALGQVSAGGSAPSAATYTLSISTDASGLRKATLGSLNGPFRYADIPLLAQNCTNSASPLLLSEATLLDVSTTSQRRAELRVPLASGGGCALVGAFGLSAEDKPPVHTEPDGRGPGQGQAQMQMKLIISPATDLKAAEPVKLGAHVHAWGDSFNLPATEAASRAAGICLFRYSYTTINGGPGVSGFTGNALSLDSVEGPLLALDALPALTPGATLGASGSIALTSGASTVVLQLDAPEFVDETSEANNVRRIDVNVTGSCD
ncbi:MAG: hypothetical protein ABI411_21600 [Tahibacter sp.]